MTQTNQTYIEEKKQEIEKAILEYLDDNGWKYGEDFYGWLIPSITQALQDAIKYGEEKNKDTQRLDFLDKMNKGLNEHYGTEYGWELILNHNVTRLFSGDINRIDLNDAKAHGAKSCRDVIDEALANLTTSEEEG